MSNDIPIFKTIEIGTYESVGDLRKALEKSGVKTAPWASCILDKVKLSKSKKTLNLVVVSVRDLGFTKGTFYQDICDAAKKRGLGLCPAEVGPQLLLQCPDQLDNVPLAIAMEPIKYFGGGFALFRVEHDGDDLWLRGRCGEPAFFWGVADQFVFVRRK